MRDLTQGPIPGHLFAMAAPIAAGMLAQTLYFLIDLYFVARLGDAALAGVGAAGIAMFVVMAMTQTLGVGAMALVAQAVGRKDPADADLVFNQSLSLAGFCTVGTLVGGYLLAGPYMRTVGADAETAAAGATYLYWFLPGLALQYVNIVMMSGLRGTGVVQPTMVVQIVTVLLNALLAPILIAGWLTGRAMGVAGAGLASTISVAFGAVLLTFYFQRLEKYIHFRPALWRPRFDVWGRMINIGLPAGGEFGFMFVFMAVIYWVIRDFGARGAGWIRTRHAADAVDLPAGDGDRIRDRPDRWPELRCKAIRAHPRDISFGRDDQRRADARDHARLPVAAGMARARLHERTRGHRGRLAFPAAGLVQLRRFGAHLHLLRDLPGARPHLARARQHGIARAHLRAAGDLDLDPAGIPDRSRLVSVGRERLGTGHAQPVPAVAHDEGEARRMKRVRKKASRAAKGRKRQRGRAPLSRKDRKTKGRVPFGARTVPFPRATFLSSRSTGATR